MACDVPFFLIPGGVGVINVFLYLKVSVLLLPPLLFS